MTFNTENTKLKSCYWLF